MSTRAKSILFAVAVIFVLFAAAFLLGRKSTNYPKAQSSATAEKSTTESTKHKKIHLVADSTPENSPNPENSYQLKGKIVFVDGDYTAGYSICVRNINSTDKHRITHISLAERTKAPSASYEEKIPIIYDKSAPRWSPDGKRIAFIGIIRTEDSSSGFPQIRDFYDIWMMNDDGTNLHPLSEVKNNDAIEFKWSPDGEKIARVFVAGVNMITDMGVIDVNGKKVTLFNLDETKEIRDKYKHEYAGNYLGKFCIKNFCWSSDSGKVIFIGAGNDGTDTDQIWVINADGTNLQPLTRGGEMIREVCWWPDGKITFRRGGGGKDIWIMNSNGTNQQCILSGYNIIHNNLDKGMIDPNEPFYVFPFWLSPDKKRIVFGSFSSMSGTNQERGLQGGAVLYGKDIEDERVDFQKIRQMLPDCRFQRRNCEYHYDLYLEK